MHLPLLGCLTKFLLFFGNRFSLPKLAGCIVIGHGRGRQIRSDAPAGPRLHAYIRQVTTSTISFDIALSNVLVFIVKKEGIVGPLVHQGMVSVWLRPGAAYRI